ncbi:MAG: pentapeptide repeat-containing protein [Myxococcales bacterium]|nr:pentapeptide repeat-containing protein [Myxococcales bacterium]MCB9546904.1 pentapeptide repeat-containing protein [Myxococcales bacterium]
MATTAYDPARWLYEHEVITWRDAFTVGEPAEFYGCTFLGCAWPGATTRRWVLEGCRFERCDLSLWRPVDCTLADAELVDCKLVGVEWTAAGGLRFDARFTDCDLSLGRFSELDLTHARFRDCRLREADLTGVKLKGAVLAGCDLEGASLDGADLTNADLRSATLPPLDLAATRLRGARVDVTTALAIVRGLGLRTE